MCRVARVPFCDSASLRSSRVLCNIGPISKYCTVQCQYTCRSITTSNLNLLYFFFPLLFSRTDIKNKKNRRRVNNFHHFFYSVAVFLCTIFAKPNIFQLLTISQLQFCMILILFISKSILLEERTFLQRTDIWSVKQKNS